MASYGSYHKPDGWLFEPQGEQAQTDLRHWDGVNADSSFAMLSSDEDERLAYLKFLRDVVLPRTASGEATCRKFPEYGIVTVESISRIIDYREAELGFQNAIQEREDNEMASMDPDFYRREAARMAEVAEILDTVPQSDTFEDGQVLTFEKHYPNQRLESVKYYHAAIKSGGYWYVTGNRSPNKVTWDALIEFIGYGCLKTLRIHITGNSVPMGEYVKGVQQALEAGDK